MRTLTKAEVLGLVNDLKKYEVLTPPHNDIMKKLDSAQIFKCKYCGEMYGYNDLEIWECDFDSDDYICMECFEYGQGEYL